MTKYIAIIMLTICSISASALGKVIVPEVVQKAFNTKFPNATISKWVKENATEYEAVFTLNGNQQSANFKNTGEWLETETTILFDQLPISVSQSFIKIHPNSIPKAVAKIETNEGIIKYEIEFKNGVKMVEEFYNEKGEII